MADFDSHQSTLQARARLPLQRVLEQHGAGPRGPGETWRKFKCPFCGGDAAGIYVKKGKPERFHCFHKPCATDNKSLDDAGLYAQFHGLSREDGWKMWLKDAGVWREEDRTAPWIGKSRRKHPAPQMPGGAEERGTQTGLSASQEGNGTNGTKATNARDESTLPEEPSQRAVPPVSPSEPTDEGTPHPKPTTEPAGTELHPTAGDVPVQTSAPAVPSLVSGGPRAAEDGLQTLPTGASSPGSPETTTLSAPAASAAGAAGNGEEKCEARSAKCEAGPQSEVPAAPAGGASNIVPMPATERAKGGGDDGDDDDGVGPLGPLQEFYDQLTLTAADRAKLEEGRGLVRMVDYCGLRSNGKSNRQILERLAEKYPVEVLLKCGLWTVNKEGVRKPNAQFCGWGVLGKKKAGKEEGEAWTEGDFEWGWCNPVIIPYFDEEGKVIALRPHKGMSRGARPRLFVVRRIADRGSRITEEEQFETVVICEGEYKGMAVKEVLPGLGACSMPGISMAKYAPVQEELLGWLRKVKPKRVIVTYDNEEKGDPKLPSYKPDPSKRHQTRIWAHFLGRLLERHRFQTTVAWLPTEWRDGKGKADWDGALARLKKGEIEGRRPKGGDGTDGTDGMNGDGDGNGNRTGLGAIRKAFLAVLDSGRTPDDYSQLTLFDRREEQIVKNGVVRLEYDPLLPYGGDKEWALARLFEKLARDKEWAHHTEARALAKAFREVVGWYYIRITKVLPKPGTKDWRFWRECQESAREQSRAAQSEEQRQLWRDRARFYEEWLNGLPDGVADFYMDCRFTLVKLDGTRDRMVILRNKIDKTKLIPLDANSFTAPRDFKRWVENQGDFTWMTGEQELEMVRRDTHQLSAFRRVYQVGHFGWHEGIGLWLAADGAVTDDGAVIKPDADGVIWWNGLGYLMGEMDYEGEGLKMGKPRWWPAWGLRNRDGAKSEVRSPKSEVSNAKDRGPNSGSGDYELVEGVEDDRQVLVDLFRELVSRARETLGGYAGYLVVGSMFAYAAAPEFVKWQRWLSGVFLHGETGSGKSTFAGWMMEIFGFDLPSGMKLPDASKPGLAIAAQQYCNLPLWLEEFTDLLDAPKAEWLKSLYMRESAPKKEFGTGTRNIRTNAIVTGENTSRVAATRQRFVHFQVSAKVRLGEHKQWFTDNSRFFFSLWRFALRNRRTFVEVFMRAWKEWGESMKGVNIDERSKGAHGLGYAGLVAFVRVLEAAQGETAQGETAKRGDGETALPSGAVVLAKDDLEAFRSFTGTYAAQAAGEVKEEVNVNVFWSLVMDAFRMGIFGHGKDLQHCFRIFPANAPGGAPPGSPNQTPGTPEFDWLPAWISYKIYVEPGFVLSKLEKYCVERRIPMPLRRRDLQAQLAMHPYFAPGEHKQRFPMDRKTPVRCWCIEVDKHPLGLQPVADEALRVEAAERGYSEFMDPRKGPLFLLIEDYERKDGL